MYADTLKTLSGTLFSTLSTVSKGVMEDPASKELIQKHTKEVLVSALSSRSPFLQEIAKSILEKLESKDKTEGQISTLLEKNKSFSTAAKAALGTEDTKKIITELSMIFKRIEQANKKDTEEYKLFGKMFETFKKIESKSESSKTNDTKTTLQNIQNNTDLTVKKLDDLVQANTPMGRPDGTKPSMPNKPVTPEEERDKKTPVPASLRERFVSTLKENSKTALASGNLFTPTGIASIVSTFFATNASSLVEKADSVVKELIKKKVSSFFEKDSSTSMEKVKENLSKSSSQTETEKETLKEELKVEGKQTELLDQMLQALRDLNKKEEAKEGAKSETGKVLDKLKSTVMAGAKILLSRVGGVLGKAASVILGSSRLVAPLVSSGTSALLKGAATAARYSTDALRTLGTSALDKGGKLINVARTTIPSIATGAARTVPALAAGASALSSFALPALAVGAAGAAGYGIGSLLSSGAEKVIGAVSGKENSIGTLFADFFKSDAEKKLDAENKTFSEKLRETNKLSSVKTISNTSKAVESMLSQKEQMAAAASSKPIIVQQNNTTSTASGGSSAPLVVGQKTVRNTESTFERVQMQDFWSRSF